MVVFSSVIAVAVLPHKVDQTTWLALHETRVRELASLAAPPSTADRAADRLSTSPPFISARDLAKHILSLVVIDVGTAALVPGW